MGAAMIMFVPNWDAPDFVKTDALIQPRRTQPMRLELTSYKQNVDLIIMVLFVAIIATWFYSKVLAEFIFYLIVIIIIVSFPNNFIIDEFLK